MKKLFVAAGMAIMILALSGCGGGGSSPPPTTFVTNIFSDPVSDGDIFRPFIPGPNIVTQGMTQAVQSVFAGINPATFDESRAFLHFPLTGVNGVPSNAIIVSAFLDIVIINIRPPVGTIPIRIDLVSFPQPLIGDDFDRNLQPALATITVIPPISSRDSGQHVFIDVTFLMREAQRLGLVDFQIRILEDFGGAPGLIEINNRTGADRSIFAPLLQVEYF